MPPKNHELSPTGKTVLNLRCLLTDLLTLPPTLPANSEPTETKDPSVRLTTFELRC